MRLMAAEDFIVSQAMSAKEDTPDYWYNALGVLAKSKLDWDYLVERASRGRAGCSASSSTRSPMTFPSPIASSASYSSRFTNADFVAFR